MSLQSMTGFARHEGQADGTAWVWELRSVNGKGLDLRFRIPSGFEAIEPLAKTALSKTFKRGNIQVGLSVVQDGIEAMPAVNNEIASALMSAAKELQERIGGELPSVGELMSMRGVLEYSESALDSATVENRNSAVMDSLVEAARSLAEMRAAEGKAIKHFLLEQVNKISALVDQIAANESRSPEAIQASLKTQISRIMESAEELDEYRLHQEAVIIAAKADLQEELDRLQVHVGAARDLLESDGPAGRKLDFLAQEFNRECNTICSKSNSAEVSSLGLDMKLIIDQFREQVQNVE